jgi:predicted acyltransferase
VDVARGLAVVGMLFVDNRGTAAITEQLVHEPWHGLRVAVVVFPVFLVVVGVSLPFSRRAQRPRAVLGRVARFVLLGWLIVTAKYGLGATSAGVLGHIAGAYLLCWLLLRLPRRAQVPVAAAVLAALSLLYLVVPVPGTGTPALSPQWSWGHWLDESLGTSFGAEAPHSYLPSAVTVFVGVQAGRTLQAHPGPAAVPRLAGSGLGLLAVGLLTGVVLPLNKQLWTPSYVLVTGGIGLLLALTHWLVDVRDWRRPFRPAEVLGRNAIVAFAVSELLFRAVLSHRVQPVIVDRLTRLTSAGAAAYLYPALSVLVVWAVCAVLARRGVIVRL